MSNIFKRMSLEKDNKMFDILGTDVEHLKIYIESMFTDGMSWDNAKEWHIDHIIPLSSANNEEELLLLCHYTNLQPLWARDNIIKSDKYNEQDKQAFLETFKAGETKK